MKMRDFFERFDVFFSVYDSIELRAESVTEYSEIYDITNEIFNYASAWWKDLNIIYFCFDSDNVLYIVAKECE